MTEQKLLIEQLRHEERIHQNSGAKALANLFASAASEVETLGEDRDSWRRVSERLESENIDLRAENGRLKKLAVEWVDLKEERPEFKGMYLSLWTDGALETYELTHDEDLEPGWDIPLGDNLITHWADLPAPPTSQGGK